MSGLENICRWNLGVHRLCAGLGIRLDTKFFGYGIQKPHISLVCEALLHNLTYTLEQYSASYCVDTCNVELHTNLPAFCANCYV